MRSTPPHQGNVLPLPGRGPRGDSTHPRPAAVFARVDEPAVTAATVRAAESTAAQAEGALRVAEAELAEALDAAPAFSPRMAAVEASAAQARDKARLAAQAVTGARRVLADREGDVETAEAHARDIRDAGTPAAAGAAVAVRVALEQAVRAVAAGRDALLDAEEAHGAAEGALAAAEQHLHAARAQPAAEPAVVVAARVARDVAQRAVRDAQDQAAATRAAYQAQLQAVEDGRRPGGPPVPQFASVDAFVEEYVLQAWRHRFTGNTRWCSRWWSHPEAVARLEAVWEAFEVLRLQPAPALSTFWRDHLDPHMRALTTQDGDFAGCSSSKHETAHQLQPLWGHDPAPAQQFAVDPDAKVQPRRVRRGQEGATA